jgi:hypothetical protein
MLLAARGEAYVLVLPDGFAVRRRDGRAVILGPAGAPIAGEGDLVGINGEVRRGIGPYCMVGPQLHVTRIVEVVARGQG